MHKCDSKSHEITKNHTKNRYNERLFSKIIQQLTHYNRQALYFNFGVQRLFIFLLYSVPASLLDDFCIFCANQQEYISQPHCRL